MESEIVKEVIAEFLAEKKCEEKLVVPAKKIKVGRPAKFLSAKSLEQGIDRYFANTDTPKICELALELGFADRQSLTDYKEHEEFTCTIKKAITRIEAHHEGQNGAGSIFWLKNHGWRDRHEIEQTGNIPKTIINVYNLS